MIFETNKIGSGKKGERKGLLQLFKRAIAAKNLYILAWVLLVGLPAAVAIAPLLKKGYPLGHDAFFHLSWVFQYQHQFLSGQFYPRWLEFSNFGLGSPTFAFYPPLSVVATLPFRLLGFDFTASLIAAVVLAISLFALGLYCYARCFYPRLIALTVAGAGILSPYFLIDIYQRGAMGEVWAIVTLPWILYASQQTIEHPQKRWPLLALTLSYGLLILSHLPTLVIFTSLWLLLPWCIRKPGQLKAGLVRCYGGLLLACGWTAFYLLPVALDQQFVLLDSINASSSQDPSSRLIISGLRQLTPQATDREFDKELVVLWQGLLWMLGLTGAALGLSQFFARRSQRLRDDRDTVPRNTNSDASLRQAAVWYWVLMSAIALFMMTDLLSWVYGVIPPLQRIQFSWRWLAIPTVTVPLLLGHLFFLAAVLLQRHKKRFIAVALAGIVIATLTIRCNRSLQILARTPHHPDLYQQLTRLLLAKEFPTEPQPQPNASNLGPHPVFPEGLTLWEVPEYRPRGANFPSPPDRLYPLLAWQTGSSDPLAVERWHYGWRQFSATNTQPNPQPIQLRTLYYPGWQVQLDDRTIPAQKTADGLLQLTIPPGQHRIVVRYQGTRSHRLGQGITALSSVSILCWFAYHQWKRKATP